MVKNNLLINIIYIFERFIYNKIYFAKLNTVQTRELGQFCPTCTILAHGTQLNHQQYQEYLLLHFIKFVTIIASFHNIQLPSEYQYLWRLVSSEVNAEKISLETCTSKLSSITKIACATIDCQKKDGLFKLGNNSSFHL